MVVEEVQVKMIARLGTKADEVAKKSAVGAEADKAAGKLGTVVAIAPKQGPRRHFY